MKRILFAVMAGCVGCAQTPPVVVQLYGAEHREDLGKRVRELVAAGTEVRLEMPDVPPPYTTDGVTIVHGSQWRAASVAWGLADALDGYGANVTVRRTRLGNHVLTDRHVAVFIGGRVPVEGMADMEEVSQLICTRSEDAEAIILLFADRRMEIQTYIWLDRAISGHNYGGSWTSGGRRIRLEPDGLEPIVFELGGGHCLPTPNTRSRCQGVELRWVSGRSVRVLEGCKVHVRNLTMVGR